LARRRCSAARPAVQVPGLDHGKTVTAGKPREATVGESSGEELFDFLFRYNFVCELLKLPP
jgi:hypothetical protein